MDDGNSVTTKLLTLLNVSATKVGKRKRVYEDHLGSSDKLNKRRSASFVEPTTPELEKEDKESEDVEMKDAEKVVEDEKEGGDEEEDESMFCRSGVKLHSLIKV